MFCFGTMRAIILMWWNCQLIKERSKCMKTKTEWMLPGFRTDGGFFAEAIRELEECRTCGALKGDRKGGTKHE